MHFKAFLKNHKYSLMGILAFFILFESLILIGARYAQTKDLNNLFDTIDTNLQVQTNLAYSNLTDMANVFYDSSINKEKIVELMSEATNTKDTKTQDIIRKQLYKTLLPTYKNMKKYSIIQLQFMLPNSISFLRFHKPNRYGDSLTKSRETINYVNKNKISITAFEQGRIFHGFRNVYPLYQGKEFVGVVEIAFSFHSLQNFLTNIDSSSYLFILKKKVIKEKVIQSEQKNYKNSSFKEYKYDTSTLNNTMQIPLDLLYKINKIIAKQVEKKLQGDKAFSISLHKKSIYNNAPIVISFLPIANLDDKVVAFIIHYSFEETISLLKNNNRRVTIALSFVAIVLSLILLLYLLYLENRQKQIFDIATHDALTGIYNRHALNDVLEQQLKEAERYDKELSVIFFDIDFFKKVNDTYGHDVGDIILKNIASLVREQLRDSDMFARWGGEEFIIFLPKTSNKNATDIAQKLRVLIKEYAFDKVDTVTCSFGVTQLSSNDDKTSFVKRVDTYLYKAKESGRDCVIDDENYS